MSCLMMLQTLAQDKLNIKESTSPKKLIHLKLICSILERINFVEESEDRYDAITLDNHKFSWLRLDEAVEWVARDELLSKEADKCRGVFMKEYLLFLKKFLESSKLSSPHLNASNATEIKECEVEDKLISHALLIFMRMTLQVLKMKY